MNYLFATSCVFLALLMGACSAEAPEPTPGPSLMVEMLEIQAEAEKNRRADLVELDNQEQMFAEATAADVKPLRPTSKDSYDAETAAAEERMESYYKENPDERL